MVIYIAARAVYGAQSRSVYSKVGAHRVRVTWKIGGAGPFGGATSIAHVTPIIIIVAEIITCCPVGAVTRAVAAAVGGESGPTRYRIIGNSKIVCGGRLEIRARGRVAK